MLFHHASKLQDPHQQCCRCTIPVCILVMDTVIDMPLPAFPANSQQDIDNQIISNVSGNRLLQGYLDQREPPYNDASQLREDALSSDAVIKCHGFDWDVHRGVLKYTWPIF